MERFRPQHYVSISDDPLRNYFSQSFAALQAADDEGGPLCTAEKSGNQYTRQPHKSCPVTLDLGGRISCPIEPKIYLIYLSLSLSHSHTRTHARKHTQTCKHTHTHSLSVSLSLSLSHTHTHTHTHTHSLSLSLSLSFSLSLSLSLSRKHARTKTRGYELDELWG